MLVAVPYVPSLKGDLLCFICLFVCCKCELVFFFINKSVNKPVNYNVNQPVQEYEIYQK